MNKLKMLGLMGISAAMFSSCAMVKSPLTGVIYTDVQAPMGVTSNSNASKAGTSKASSVLGIVATGDASISAAAKKAGITKIQHVDEHVMSILGIYASYSVTVYGE